MQTVNTPPNYNVLFRQYVERFKLTNRGKQATGLCPFHDDHHPSLSISMETGCYWCHSCSAKGNAYQFAGAMNHPNPIQWIEDTGKQPYRGNYEPKTPTVDLFKPAKEYQKNLSDQWIMNLNREKRMCVGSDQQGRLTFPYFDEDGNIIGIKHHKSTNGEQPYWEGDGKCKWYGLPLLKGFDRNKNLYICEGEEDCIRWLSQGYQTTTGSAGAGSIPRDMKSISGFREYITIYDNDSAGYDGAEKLAEGLGVEI